MRNSSRDAPLGMFWAFSTNALTTRRAKRRAKFRVSLGTLRSIPVLTSKPGLDGHSCAAVLRLGRPAACSRLQNGVQCDVRSLGRRLGW